MSMVTSGFFGNVGKTENLYGIFRTQRFDQVEMSSVKVSGECFCFSCLSNRLFRTFLKFFIHWPGVKTMLTVVFCGYTVAHDLCGKQ